MVFQPGNKLGKGRKDKPFRDALMMELKAAGEDKQALRAVAAALLLKCTAGEIAAIRELADRIDGKVAQPVVGDDEEAAINIIHRIERIIVSPPDTNSESVPPATEPSSV